MSHLLCVDLQLFSPLDAPGTTCFSCLHHVVGSAPPSAAPSANLSCEHPPHSACSPWDPRACQRPALWLCSGLGAGAKATRTCPLRPVRATSPVDARALFLSLPDSCPGLPHYPVWGHSPAHTMSSAQRIPMHDAFQGRPSGHTGGEQTSAE